KLPSRVKAEAKMVSCGICQQELKITKTNTELQRHAESKHGKVIEECFPGATAIAAEMAAAVGKGGKGGGKTAATGKKGKKQDAGDLDDLLNAGLTKGKKKK
ncbi:MAG: hypothetical protein SGARI_004621, partial [Bacillariaceae sp.]